MIDEVMLAIGLASSILFLAYLLGLKILKKMRVDDLEGLERFIFGLPLGLGVLAYIVFFLGVSGILNQYAFLLLILFVIVLTWKEIRRAMRVDFLHFKHIWNHWQGQDLKVKVGILIVIVILCLTLLQSLTPPWDYDGLMYHLQGSKLFLERGRIVLLPDLWQANGANAPDMLYLFGLAFGSDIFAKLLHYSYAVIILFAVYAFGKRFFGRLEGLIATFVLVSIPSYQIWASFAYTDMALTSYTFLSIYSFFLWRGESKYKWLAISGILSGCSLGSKYTAIFSVIILGALIAFESRQFGYKQALKNVSLYLLITVIIGLPWYLKNFLLSGNPVYPFILGGPGWSQDRLKLLMDFLQSFGSGNGLWDYLKLPVDIFLEREKFNTFMGNTDIPSPLFLLVIFLPFIHKTTETRILAWYSFIFFLFWSLGSQQTRFLLPIFPPLSLLSTEVLITLSEKLLHTRQARIIIPGLVGGVLVASLWYSINYFNVVGPLPVITNSETKDSFLKRMVFDYEAMKFVQNKIREDERVLMMWDGQGYYCDQRCLPDPDQSQWVRMVDPHYSYSRVIEILQMKGITHLLFSGADLEFIASHDPSGRHLRAYQFFTEVFAHKCTKEIFNDEYISIYQLSCLE